jgi:TP901 family phage tail tape measure protein
MATTGSLIAGRAFVLIEAIDKTALVLSRVQGHIRQFANQMQAIGTITLKVSIGSALPLGYAVKQYADFQSRMSRIGILMDEPGKHLEAATNRIRELAKEFGKPIEEVQAGYTTMISGGMDPKQVEKEFEYVLKTARATRSEIVNVAEGARRMVMAYGMTVQQATDFMLAVDVGGVDFNEMAGGLGVVAGMAQSAGVEWQELGAMIGAISTVLPTQETLTAINNLSAKITPGRASKDALAIAAEFGINLDEMVLKGQTFFDLLMRIWQFPGKSEAQVTKAMAEIFPDIRGGKGLSQLLLHPETYYRMLDLVTNSAGRTNKAWDLVSNDSLVLLEQAWAKIKDIALTIGGSLEPATKQASKYIADLSQRVNDFVGNNERLIVSWAAATAGLLAFGGAAVATGLAFRLLAFSLTPLILILDLLLSPFRLLRWSLLALAPLLTMSVTSGPFIILAMVLTRLSVVLYQNRTAVLAWVQSLNQSTGWADNLKAAMSELSAFGESMKDRFISLGDTIRTTFMGVTDALMMGDLESSWQILMDGMDLAWEQMLDVLYTTWEEFYAYLDDAWKGLAERQAKLANEMADAGGPGNWLINGPQQGATPDKAFWEPLAESMWRAIGVTWEPLAGKQEEQQYSLRELADLRAEQVAADATAANMARLYPQGFGPGQTAANPQAAAADKLRFETATARSQEISSILLSYRPIEEMLKKLQEYEQQIVAWNNVLLQANAGGNQPRIDEALDEIHAYTELIQALEMAYQALGAPANVTVDDILGPPGADANNAVDIAQGDRARAMQARRVALQEKLDALADKRWQLDQERIKTEIATKFGGTTGDMAGLAKSLLPSWVADVASNASGILGAVAGKLFAPSMADEIKGGIPATETAMKNSKEAADAIKKAWQEAHMPAKSDPKEQANNTVRQKILDLLPKINGFLQEIAKAEGV